MLRIWSPYRLSTALLSQRLQSYADLHFPAQDGHGPCLNLQLLYLHSALLQLKSMDSHSLLAFLGGERERLRLPPPRPFPWPPPPPLRLPPPRPPGPDVPPWPSLAALLLLLPPADDPCFSPVPLQDGHGRRLGPSMFSCQKGTSVLSFSSQVPSPRVLALASQKVSMAAILPAWLPLFESQRRSHTPEKSVRAWRGISSDGMAHMMTMMWKKPFMADHSSESALDASVMVPSAPSSSLTTIEAPSGATPTVRADFVTRLRTLCFSASLLARHRLMGLGKTRS